MAELYALKLVNHYGQTEIWRLGEETLDAMLERAGVKEGRHTFPNGNVEEGLIFNDDVYVEVVDHLEVGEGPHDADEEFWFTQTCRGVQLISSQEQDKLRLKPVEFFILKDGELEQVEQAEYDLFLESIAPGTTTPEERAAKAREIEAFLAA